MKKINRRLNWQNKKFKMKKTKNWTNEEKSKN